MNGSFPDTHSPPNGDFRAFLSQFFVVCQAGIRTPVQAF
jgi:hypothetical protein